MTDIDQLAEGTESDGMEPDDQAPYGYMIDKGTGVRRPRLRPPTRGPAAAHSTGVISPLPPSLDVLRAGEPVSGTSDDRVPGVTRRKRRRGRRRDSRVISAEPPAEVPPFRAGPIAKGMNRFYRRAGKIIKVWDKGIGQAIIATTRKVDEDDLTVGEAWEELAKINPAIRSMLLHLVAGGAWSALFIVHGPIFMAILMKPAVQRHIPFHRLFEAFFNDDQADDDDDDQDDDDDGDMAPAGAPPSPFSGMTEADFAQAAAFAQQMAGSMFGGGRPRSTTNGTGRPAAVVPELVNGVDVVDVDEVPEVRDE